MKDQSDGFWREYKGWLIAAGFVVALPAGAYFVWFSLLSGLEPSRSPSTWGEFGDFMGGVLNPFVAAAALLWLMRSVHIQKKELLETRTVMEEQADTIAVQRFEGTFFSLLNQIDKELERLAHPPRQNTMTISNIMFDVMYNYSSVEEGRRVLMTEYSERISIFYRQLYQTLKFISEHYPRINDEAARLHQEKLYSNILRSHLGTSSIRILAILCATQDQDDPFYRFKQLIEKYEFLEHMPFDFEKLHGTNYLHQVLDIYHCSAFGDGRLAGYSSA